MPGDLQNPLEISVAQLFGVGPERAAQLARLQIFKVIDLLLHRPSRYEDRRRFATIAELEKGVAALTCGKIVAAGLKTWRKGAKSVFEMILEDGTGRLHCRWWNLPYMQKYFQVGDEVVIFGKPVSLKPRTIDHPEHEVIDAIERSLHLNRIVPIYPLTEGLPQRWLRSTVWRTLQGFEHKISEPRPEILIPDMPSRANAIHMLHFPEAMDDVEVARRRLALDEFIELQFGMQLRRKRLEENAQGLKAAGDNHLIRPFLRQIGFELTEAQTKVLREIRHDMTGPLPMRRLLQGDVGSGKTVVAACTALMALESGLDVALMSPSEVLAEQHWLNFKRWFEPLGVKLELRTSFTNRQGNQVRGAATPRSRGPILSIGTQALIQDSFAPEKLGLVIVDEQHKFGVAQRETLVRKGAYPHLLVMTATPIPRTLGLTLYGDLDISVIDQLPPGRGRISTYVRTSENLPKVWDFLRQQLNKGRQGYVIYSRLEDADPKAGLKSLLSEFDNLKGIFEGFSLGLIHGRMSSEQKEETMANFRSGKIQLLVATSVVEVGVDVPNATFMLIENAEQFGLAQLHQLRGRIGRGAGDSFCILLASAKTEGATARLRTLERTTNGFEIAEADLKLRGPGEMLGNEQSGAPSFRFGDLSEDLQLVERARSLVRESLMSK